jgi:hypothetical protein
VNSCFRLDDFATNVATIQDLMTELQKEDLSNEEYKDLQAKYQVSLFCVRLVPFGMLLFKNLCKFFIPLLMTRYISYGSVCMSLFIDDIRSLYCVVVQWRQCLVLLIHLVSVA